jgi:hypothetical protein
MVRRIIVLACFAAAFAISASAAQAAGPHWYWGKPVEEIPANKPVPITTEGKLAFTVVNAAGEKRTTKCMVTDREVIENPLSGGPGVDTMTSFVISGCGGKAACSSGALIVFQATGLPWSSVLLAGPPILDEIKGVEIQEQCGGAVLSTFKGTWTPEIKGWGGLKFGPGSGTLVNEFAEPMTVKGTDKLIGPAPKTKIGAK